MFNSLISLDQASNPWVRVPQSTKTGDKDNSNFLPSTPHNHIHMHSLASGILFGSKLSYWHHRCKSLPHSPQLSPTGAGCSPTTCSWCYMQCVLRLTGSWARGADKQCQVGGKWARCVVPGFIMGASGYDGLLGVVRERAHNRS